MITSPDLRFERRLWRSGLKYVIGLDEAGRGALAGPVVVGAVCLPDHPQLKRELKGVRDSKLLSPDEREQLVPRIRVIAITWGVGYASSQEIDWLGIVPATRLAALRAMENIAVIPDYLLTDFRLELPELDLPQTAIVKGDQLCLSIAAGSILAKTARDALMRQLDTEYSFYGLANHKGYATLRHRRAIMEMGFSPIHRKTFAVKAG
jgi:ribonuclease HII